MNWQLTATAQNHLERAIIETREKWGNEKAKKYAQDLIEGFDKLASGQIIAKNLHQEKLTHKSQYSIFLCAHRYIVYQKSGNELLIVALFHAKMDIPNALSRLENE